MKKRRRLFFYHWIVFSLVIVVLFTVFAIKNMNRQVVNMSVHVNSMTSGNGAGIHLRPDEINSMVEEHGREVYKIFIGFAAIFFMTSILMFIWYRRIKNEEAVERDVRLAEIGRLVSGIVHDMSNPLAVIVQIPDLIDRSILETIQLEGELTVTQKEKLINDMRHASDLIRTSSKRESILVQEIKDIVRGEMQLNYECIELKELLDEIEENYSDYVRKLSVNISVEGKVLLDKTRFERVFSNLIKNACEASSGKAEVKIDVSKIGEYIRIKISDDGPGVPKKIQKKIFILGNTFNKANGTGLGLYVVKKIVDAHGGKIHLESKVGHGTAFIIDIPAKRKDELEST